VVVIRRLLVLDLDETLIYANECPLDRPADFEVAPYFVYLRPGVKAAPAAQQPARLP
jgi:RNA polymerase II subunit A small phosphatase-like protein